MLGGAADLRSTHFRLGDSGASWETTSRAAMAQTRVATLAERRATADEMKTFKAELSRLHFSLGDEDRTSYATTNTMPSFDVRSARAAAIVKDTHRTTFVLGDESTEYRTTVMTMTGMDAAKLHDPYIPQRDGSWKAHMDTIAKRKGV